MLQDSIQGAVRDGGESFWQDDEVLMFAGERRDTDSILTSLSFKVSRKPKDLASHLRRIYFCYQQRLSEPLYAALLDLLIILDGKGQELARRLIQSCLAGLDVGQRPDFDNPAYARQLAGNRYSLFTVGVLGSNQLVEALALLPEQRDFLALAHDFIEYSQLDEAMMTLETGLDTQPERQDLQAALLELYKSTVNRHRFHATYQRLNASGAVLLKEWRLLADYFDGR